MHKSFMFSGILILLALAGCHQTQQVNPGHAASKPLLSVMKNNVGKKFSS